TEACTEQGLSADHPVDRAIRGRVAGLLEAYLRREAAGSPTPLPDAGMLEAEFGEDTERGPLLLGGLALHGRIDRVDVAGRGGAGVVGDARRGKAPRHDDFEKQGKLQLALYMLALRDLWEIEPLAGLYTSLSATRDPRPRGLALAPERDAGLAGLELVSTD